MSPCGADLAQVLTSDDTRAGRKGRDEPVPVPARSARRVHSGIAIGRRLLHTCQLSNMEITPLTPDCCIFHRRAHDGTSSYFETGYKYKLLHNNRTENMFFVFFSLSSEPRRKWGWYGDSAAITHSLIERQRLDTLSASGLKREKQSMAAWLNGFVMQAK